MNIDLGLELLTELIELRVRQHKDDDLHDGVASVRAAVEDLELINNRRLTYAETVVLLLALAPGLQPDLLDRAFLGSLDSAGEYPEFGGIRGQQHRGFIPTAQTAMFLLEVNTVSERAVHMRMFEDGHFFSSGQMLELVRTDRHEPQSSGLLVANEDFLSYLVTGQDTAPRFSTEFPAQQLTTERSWDDLILSEQTVAALDHIKNWLTHRNRLLDDWKLSGVLQSSYTCLFHGPPGSGKTFTASLFSKLGYPVYRIDLAMVVSKFIGETEKNLEKVFQRAQRKNWILFFDEAEALFSKRTGVRDAHDKYANQEVAYLLQRIERFSGSGLVILATNLKGNIDAAFLRRFQSIIYFPTPNAMQRLKIWHNLIPQDVSLDPGIDVEDLFRKYELSGGSIVNIVQFCLVRAAGRNSNRIRAEDIFAALNTEYEKEGKTL